MLQILFLSLFILNGEANKRIIDGKSPTGKLSPIPSMYIIDIISNARQRFMGCVLKPRRWDSKARRYRGPHFTFTRPYIDQKYDIQ